MLDQETEYIDYLRNRKKFFVMTQIQQTRVTIAKRKTKAKKEEEKKKKRGGKPWWMRSKKKGKKKTLLQKAKKRAQIAGRKTKVGIKKKVVPAANKISKFTKRKAKDFVTVGNKVKGGATKLLSAAKNKIVPTGGIKPSQLSRVIPKGVRKKVVEKLVQKGASKTLQKAGTKVATKVAAKTAVKIGLKKIPVVGLIAGLGFGVQRLMKGDVTGALMEAGSGLASTIPGAGTAISIGIDSALMAKDVAGLKDGGEVSSPTQALIAEGGEPELVVPHSKLGPVFQSLLKQVGTILTDVTTGFLSTLPVPTAASSAILGESAKLAAVFGGTSTPMSVFKGSKIKKAAAGFLKRMGGGALNLAKSAIGMTPMGMAAGAIGSLLGGRPAKADGKKETFRKRTVNNTMSEVNGVMTSSSWDSDTATSLGNFPVTDTFGSTEGRSRPHGGVDLGTPVGTPVGFTEPGEILAAGKYGGYGNMMDVWLPAAKIQMRIAHLSKFVKRTGEFMAGEKLAETGGAVGDPGAGSSTGPHLHFEADNKRNSTRYGGAGNPMPYAPLLSFSAVEPPSGEGGKGGMGLGTSYGYPLTNTIKWPSSGGSMGGPSLAPSGGGSIGTIKQPMMIPIPFSVQIPVPVEVTKIISEKSKSIKAYGIDPFSGKYGEL
tara:strand:+ start:3032 stop:4996 length:1965 start_codon:yes stop_codon:yes gene_type:complete